MSLERKHNPKPWGTAQAVLRGKFMAIQAYGKAAAGGPGRVAAGKQLAPHLGVDTLGGKIG